MSFPAFLRQLGHLFQGRPRRPEPAGGPEPASGDLAKRYRDLRYAVDESAIFAITDARGVILEVNERFCQVSGYSREELVGCTHGLLNSGYHPREFFQDLWTTIRAGRVWRGEIRNRAKDGSIYWVDATIVPWADAQGRPERFFSLRTVITERKRAEEALVRRRRQLELLVAASRELNQDLDLPVVMRRLVETGVNLTSAASGTYGLLEGSLLRTRELFEDGTWSRLDLVFQTGEGVPGWVLATRQSCLSADAERDPRVTPGHLRRLGLRSFAVVPILDRKGELLGFFGIHNKVDGAFTDEDRSLLEGLAAHAAVAMANAQRLEAQRHEQEALRQAQKLESLSQLVGGLAHDFNNLLAAILGNLNLATRSAPAGSDLARHLDSIDLAATRASGLTQQMLACTGKSRSQVERLELNGLARRVAQQQEVALPRSTLVELSLDAGLPALDGDPAQLEQVIRDLVNNAADAIGERGGTIRVATAQAVLDEAGLRRLLPGWRPAPGAYQSLEVADDGHGMAPEVLERIFDPFFSTKGLGRGLGLPALAGILKAHRGGLAVASAPGRGSSFRIYLPAAAAAPAAPERADNGAWTGHGTILVVDDDELVRSVNRAQVELLGFRTLEAVDGVEAVEVFRAHRKSIDLVFMDLSMPRMDGREAMGAIRALEPEARIVLCSGFNEETARPDATAGPPTAFLQKPFRKEALGRVLRDALGDAPARDRS